VTEYRRHIAGIVVHMRIVVSECAISVNFIHARGLSAPYIRVRTHDSVRVCWCVCVSICVNNLYACRLKHISPYATMHISHIKCSDVMCVVNIDVQTYSYTYRTINLYYDASHVWGLLEFMMICTRIFWHEHINMYTFKYVGMNTCMFICMNIYTYPRDHDYKLHGKNT